jgi:hypothetical protein
VRQPPRPAPALPTPARAAKEVGPRRRSELTVLEAVDTSLALTALTSLLPVAALVAWWRARRRR